MKSTHIMSFLQIF